MNVIEVLALDAGKSCGAFSTCAPIRSAKMHPPISAAEMLPFVVASQAVRTSMGSLCEGMDVASLTCELNVARAAGGLLLLKHMQTQLANTCAACACFDAETARRERARSDHFHVEKLPLVNASSLYASYRGDQDWPDALYWYIWYAMSVKNALAKRCPSSALAGYVDRTVLAMRNKLSRVTDGVDTSTCSSFVLSSLGDQQPLVDSALVARIAHHASDCDLDASSPSAGCDGASAEHDGTCGNDGADEDDDDEDEIEIGDDMDDDDDGDHMDADEAAGTRALLEDALLIAARLHAMKSRGEVAEGTGRQEAEQSKCSVTSETTPSLDVARQTHESIRSLMSGGDADHVAAVSTDDVIQLFSGGHGRADRPVDADDCDADGKQRPGTATGEGHEQQQAESRAVRAVKEEGKEDEVTKKRNMNEKKDEMKKKKKKKRNADRNKSGVRSAVEGLEDVDRELLSDVVRAMDDAGQGSTGAVPSVAGSHMPTKTQPHKRAPSRYGRLLNSSLLNRVLM